MRSRISLPLAGTVTALCIVLLFSAELSAVGAKRCVSTSGGKGSFTLSSHSKSSPICLSSKDYSGVRLIAEKYFAEDIVKITGARPEMSVDSLPGQQEIILVGTIGKNPMIDRLIAEKRIDVNGIKGNWESFVIQTVDTPFLGVERALVIAGSDKRGTIYGMFSISEQIGVSPWYWWADVPVERNQEIFITPGRYADGPPSVKYRGIFLNDEWPDLTKWVIYRYGRVLESKHPPIPVGVANCGHKFYEKIFELLLRLRANYLWPAMWDNAFNEDDSLNARLADEYGIVMGTSHQEPMLRAQKEWDRRYLATLGSWNYAKYPDTLENFWREGVRRNRNYESIVTIGLRGANDTPMAPGGPDSNMASLEKIVRVQRQIMSEEVNPDVTKIPQSWCLYKEVQDYYEAGMRVPDDVTLLWADDNWGNIRRLPTGIERKRTGGAGVYYHFDYHGGPRSYQWINTNPLPKIWDQMSLAVEYGAQRIWVVNVGHFKGYELPVEFFMDLAWDSKRWTGGNLDEYTRLWAEREFGPLHAAEIASIMSSYTKYNGRIKPELLSPTTYSMVNYREAERVVSDFNSIASKAERIHEELPTEYRDAFFELVLFPTKASANLNELYFAAGRNALYAKQRRSETNEMASLTRKLFNTDTSLMGYFNRDFAGGKWNHFMDQTHIGYTNWQDPPTNTLRAIVLKELEVPDTSDMGVAIEGSEDSWPGSEGTPILPGLDSFGRERRYIEIFNRGARTFEYTAVPNESWIEVSSGSGQIDKQTRIWVGIDWTKAPKGRVSGTIRINGAERTVAVRVDVFNPKTLPKDSLTGFVEENGYVSMEACHYTGKRDVGERMWTKIQGYGHTLSGMRAEAPVDSPAATPSGNAPSLEYRMFSFSSGKASVDLLFGSTLNLIPGRGLRYAISLDDEAPQVITLVPENYNAQNGNRDWEESVIGNGRHSVTVHKIPSPGYHTIRIWMVDPGVVLEKIVLNCGGVRESYLGPPETFRGKVGDSK